MQGSVHASSKGQLCPQGAIDVTSHAVRGRLYSQTSLCIVAGVLLVIRLTLGKALLLFPVCYG